MSRMISVRRSRLSMLKSATLSLAMVSCAFVGACASPSAPATPSLRYDGEWSGTTSQGRSIAFRVSSDQKVTAITVGYTFNGCSGVHTFSNLNVDIADPPRPIGNPRGPTTPSLGPAFGYESGPFTEPNYTQISGFFTSNNRATGSVGFGDYPGCGNGGGIWTATKP